MLFYKQSLAASNAQWGRWGVWAVDLLAVASRSKVKGRFASIAYSAPPLPSKNLSFIGSDE